MEIHRYEKLWLGASLLLIVTFIATVAYGAIGPGVAMIDETGGTISPDELSEDERFSEPRVEHVGGDEYEVYVVAYHPIFQPSEIRVPEGSTVTFYLTSGDVVHGFNVAGTNVNTMVIPGQVSKLTVEFDEPGEYGIVCNEYCGPAHHDMEGKLIVVPESEWEGDGQ